VATLEPNVERLLLAVAHALFMNRLHLLRLTEVVRHGIRPNPEDGVMELPEELDVQMKQQAIDFVLTCFPPEMSMIINQHKADWLRPA
jgi:hypothetical protein